LAALDSAGVFDDDAGMKICHVITRMIVGGAMENTLLTCEGLHQRGHDVTLITGPAIGPEGELLTRARSGGYELIVLDAMRREIHPLRDRRTLRSLRELLARISPDIVHTHASKAGILGRKAAAQVGGMKIVHTVHGLPFHPYQSAWLNRLYVALEKRAARRTDAIISVADAMTAQALAAGVGSPEQYTTIYSGMVVDRFAEPGEAAQAWRESLRVRPEQTVVMQVSRIAPLKGHDFLLAAAKQIDRDDIVFCLVGDGPWRRRIEAEISRRGLASRFRLTGLVDPEEIPPLLRACDILAHCSLREGLARALPQALLAGRPVISFDVDGAGEVVDHDTGILLPPRDTDGLAAAIETLADHPPLRDRLGAAGRDRCREMFDHNRMVDRIEELYKRLV
jgi:glycosyltransferase involved in cell wall biosynthesis